jgi:glycosyltransferase involved in cell wall biosynthesis
MTFPYSHIYFAFKVAKTRKVPFVITPLFHYKFPEHYNSYLIDVLRKTDATIALTSFEKQILLKLGAKLCYVIPPGIWVNEWINLKEDSVREQMNLKNYFVISIPRKSYKKGAIHVLASSVFLKRMGINVAVLAFGKTFEQHLWGRWKRYAIMKGVKVLDYDYVDEELKRKSYMAADVVAMPSIADAYGIAYLEAWACRKPVIGAKIPVMQEIIKDGVDGYLVPFGDIGELAHKLYLLAKKPQLRDYMGEEGFKKVIRYHDWSSIAERVEKVYYEVVKNK